MQSSLLMESEALAIHSKYRFISCAYQTDNTVARMAITIFNSSSVYIIDLQHSLLAEYYS